MGDCRGGVFSLMNIVACCMGVEKAEYIFVIRRKKKGFIHYFVKFHKVFT